MENQIQNEISEVIETCGKTRQALNKIHWKRLISLFKACAETFSISEKIPSALNQFVHYKDGGYPSEKSPPRFEDAACKLGNMFMAAYYISESEEINKVLEKKFGLRLVFVKEPKPLTFSFSSELKEKLLKLKLDYILSFTNPTDILKAFSEEIDKTQTTICHLSDSIKIDGFSRIKQHIGKFDKASFLKTIGIKATILDSKLKGTKKKQDLHEGIDLLKKVTEENLQ